MPETEKRRNHFIDIIKGISIIFISVTHYTWTTQDRKMFLFPFWIGMAVPVFMLISGYVHALSFRRKGIDSLKKAYDPLEIISRLLRYIIPFAFFCILREAAFLSFGKTGLSRSYLIAMIKRIITGGQGKEGQGGYYVPVMMQFVLFYPLIYFSIAKFGKKGLAVNAGANLLFEVLKNFIGIFRSHYHLFFFRYVFVVAAGCYLADEKKRMDYPSLLISFAAGTGFLIARNYFGFKPVIVNFWSDTSFVACLYVIPILYILITRFGNLRNGFLERIGKASYEIYLAQMFWYLFIGLIGPDYTDNNLYFLTSSRALAVVINVTACLVLGLLYYRFENPLTGKIIGLVKRLLGRNNGE